MPRNEDKPERLRSQLRENLEARCRDCEHCHGAGMVTIFHERYAGEAYVELRRNVDGKRRKYALRAAVPCVCALGSWIRDQQTNGEATALRQIDLQHVLEGMDAVGRRVPWSLVDPTLPYVDESEEVEPGSFRRMIEQMSAGSVSRERPQFEGSEASARRDMAEPRHPLDAARSERRAVVPDDYGLPTKQDTPPIDDDIPF